MIIPKKDMGSGTRRFPIKLEDSSGSEDSGSEDSGSESCSSSGDDTPAENTPDDETPSKPPNHGPPRPPRDRHDAMAWFMKQPPEIHATLLECCISGASQYHACRDDQRGGVVEEAFWTSVRDKFNETTRNLHCDCTLRSWRFVRECVEEICNARSAAAPHGPLPYQHPELDVRVARWNAIVSGREQPASSTATLDDPEFRLEFVRCCQCRESDLAAVEDEEYTPATEIWSCIATHFNDIVGLRAFDGWESARRTAVAICAPRYQMAACGRLPPPSGKLEEAIDQWNECLRHRKLGRAFGLAESVLWPAFQEKVRAAVQEEAAACTVDITAMPRNEKQRDRLIARLGQILRDNIRANREKAACSTEEEEQATRRLPTGLTTNQAFTPAPKRTTRDHAQTVSSKKRKHSDRWDTGDANKGRLSSKQTKGSRSGGSELGAANAFSSGKHGSEIKSRVKFIAARPKRHSR